MANQKKTMVSCSLSCSLSCSFVMVSVKTIVNNTSISWLTTINHGYHNYTIVRINLAWFTRINHLWWRHIKCERITKTTSLTVWQTVRTNSPAAKITLWLTCTRLSHKTCALHLFYGLLLCITQSQLILYALQHLIKYFPVLNLWKINRIKFMGKGNN